MKVVPKDISVTNSMKVVPKDKILEFEKPEDISEEAYMYEEFRLHKHFLCVSSGTSSEMISFRVHCSECGDKHSKDFDTEDTDVIPHLKTYMLNKYTDTCDG